MKNQTAAHVIHAIYTTTARPESVVPAHASSRRRHRYRFGAHTVLTRGELGERLLIAGVWGVRGAFASGQALQEGLNSKDSEVARSHRLNPGQCFRLKPS